MLHFKTFWPTHACTIPSTNSTTLLTDSGAMLLALAGRFGSIVTGRLLVVSELCTLTCLFYVLAESSLQRENEYKAVRAPICRNRGDRG
jgi:hypothetical protein